MQTHNIAWFMQQFSKQFVSLYVKISIKSRPGKKRQSLEHIFCTSKYQRGIDFIFKNNCQSDLKEMTSWGSTYFFHFCGRVSSKYWLLLRMWAELIYGGGAYFTCRKFSHANDPS